MKLYDVDEAQVTKALAAVQDIVKELHDNDLLRGVWVRVCAGEQQDLI